MSNDKQSSFDYFHDRVMEMISRKRPMTSNDVAQTWLDAKELHKQEIKNAWSDSRDIIFYDSDKDSLSEETANDLAEQYYKETFGDNK